MKILHLLRHAKSSRDDPSLADFDRPLAPRGRTDAPRVAARMAAAEVRPDRVAVSAARRTRETWDLVAPAVPAIAVDVNPSLYLCGIRNLTEYVRAFSEDVATALVVGHNPDLEDFALLLANDARDAGDLARLRAKFPTGAWAELHLAVDRWAAIGGGCGTLARLIRPRDLAD